MLGRDGVRVGIRTRLTVRVITKVKIIIRVSKLELAKVPNV